MSQFSHFIISSIFRKFKENEFLQELKFSNPYILQPESLNHRLFYLTEFKVWNIKKYTTSGCKSTGIIKSGFMTKPWFCWVLRLKNKRNSPICCFHIVSFRFLCLEWVKYPYRYGIAPIIEINLRSYTVLDLKHNI